MLEILSVARSLDGSQMLYLHSLISVIELGVTAFLCAINPANAIVIPSSWAFLYLPDLFKAPLPMGAPEPREQDRKDRIPCLKDALISFCGAFDDWSYGMNHSLQLRGFHGRVYTGILRKRVFDLLATVILNLNHYPSRLRDMDNFWRRITKVRSFLSIFTPADHPLHFFEP